VLRLLQTDQAARLLSAAAPERAELVTSAIAVLSARPAEPWTLDEIARVTGTSVPTLTRHFRRMTGMSPMQYLKRLRLGEARRRMLVEGDTAAQAAAAVGYASDSHFSRDYRRAYEAAPAADVAAVRGRVREAV
jgi:AraC-like DNA-binding protein